MGKRTAILLLAVVLVVFAAVVGGHLLWQRRILGDVAAPGAGPDLSRLPATWVGRDACRSCHAAADSLWSGSDHDLAMQAPSPASVTADFDGAAFTHFGVTSTFHRDGSRYMVRTDGPDGRLADFEVAYVFGHFPLEQFLIRFPDGRLQCLNVCWDSRPAADGGQRWFHLYPDEEVPADDLFHWTGMLQTWNFMCAECHSTHLERNYDPATDTYATTWAEIDVSCEACHGPGSRHVAWERAHARGLRPRDPDGARGLVVNLAAPDSGLWVFEEGKTTAVRTAPLASRVEAEHCARCHSRRAALTEDYVYGRPYGDHHDLALLEEGLYHADGQNQDEVYVYGSFLQSKMHAAGVTCSDCHDVHSGRTLGTGNQVCARCHRAEVYDTPRHHFHQPGKGGDSCLDCHQQSRDVMVVDGRRDHSFRIPRPDLSLALGTPNACSDCHADKPVAWAQDAVVKWYGAERKQGEHYAEALHAGRLGAPGAVGRLRKLIADAEKPGIVRATALQLLGRHAAVADVPEAVAALGDPDPLVRRAAVQALGGSDPARLPALAGPLLEDPVRDVRYAAAAVLALLPREVAGPSDPLVTRAAALHEERLNAYPERPENLLQLAALRAHQGDHAAAEDLYRQAVAREPRFAAAAVNYADYLRGRGRDAAAEDVLRRALTATTDTADLHHALGLLEVRRGDMAAALADLRAAAADRPEYARYGYVLAVALHESGDVDGSLDALDAVTARHPWDRPALEATALYALQAERPRRGLAAAERLVQLSPGDPRPRELAASLRRAAGR